ncbi:hypothetical protein BKA70DRAFT_1280459 [Coprinopsis sp. MPI-PUGE-AT-0042]|nr:hypothetical protein BKA70DRAFT_1280459 [Coprinopsis sp. MPI-PUGE-AT-0042]
MATVAFTIYSHYDPKDRERLERETGQIPDDEDSEEIWRKEAARMQSKKPQPPAPRFLNQSTHPRLDHPTNPTPSSCTSTEENRRQSLTRMTGSLRKAMQSEPGSVSAPVTPAPSLAELLKREPPPLPSEARVKAPVWTSIGPSNKGFSMLQRSGWNEGETLGPYALRQRPSEPTLPEALRLQPRPHSQPSFGKGKVEIKMEEYGDDISEVKHVEIVDLTLTSDSEGEEEKDTEKRIEEPVQEAHTMDEDISGHGGRALLAPIATILKADRMGIGLKPKTIAGPSGAYRIPQKRVTHNAAAMAAHIRAGEELRRQKRDHGRGHRAFARKKRKEATERKEMLAYLNS